MSSKCLYNIYQQESKGNKEKNKVSREIVCSNENNKLEDTTAIVQQEIIKIPEKQIAMPVVKTGDTNCMVTAQQPIMKLTKKRRNMFDSMKNNKTRKIIIKKK